MPFDPNVHHRRSIRLRGYDYGQAGAYFVTICTHERECLFGEVCESAVVLNACGCSVRDEWLKSEQIRPYIWLDEFVVMPNHIHGVVFLERGEDEGLERATQRVAPTEGVHGPAARSIGAMIGQFKAAVTKRIWRECDMTETPVWQRNYYEHIIRGEKELDAIRLYIANNPLNWLQDTEYPDNMKGPAR